MLGTRGQEAQFEDRLNRAIRIAEKHSGFSKFADSYPPLFKSLWKRYDPKSEGLISVANANLFAQEMMQHGWSDWNPTHEEAAKWEQAAAVHPSRKIPLEWFAEMSENSNFDVSAAATDQVFNQLASSAGFDDKGVTIVDAATNTTSSSSDSEEVDNNQRHMSKKSKEIRKKKANPLGVSLHVFPPDVLGVIAEYSVPSTIWAIRSTSSKLRSKIQEACEDRHIPILVFEDGNKVNIYRFFYALPALQLAGTTDAPALKDLNPPMPMKKAYDPRDFLPKRPRGVSLDTFVESVARILMLTPNFYVPVQSVEGLSNALNRWVEAKKEIGEECSDPTKGGDSEESWAALDNLNERQQLFLANLRERKENLSAETLVLCYGTFNGAQADLRHAFSNCFIESDVPYAPRPHHPTGGRNGNSYSSSYVMNLAPPPPANSSYHPVTPSTWHLAPPPRSSAKAPVEVVLPPEALRHNDNPLKPQMDQYNEAMKDPKDPYGRAIVMPPPPGLAVGYPPQLGYNTPPGSVLVPSHPTPTAGGEQPEEPDFGVATSAVRTLIKLSFARRRQGSFKDPLPNLQQAGNLFGGINADDSSQLTFWVKQNQSQFLARKEDMASPVYVRRPPTGGYHMSFEEHSPGMRAAANMLSKISPEFWKYWVIRAKNVENGDTHPGFGSFTHDQMTRLDARQWKTLFARHIKDEACPGILVGSSSKEGFTYELNDEQKLLIQYLQSNETSKSKPPLKMGQCPVTGEDVYMQASAVGDTLGTRDHYGYGGNLTSGGGVGGIYLVDQHFILAHSPTGTREGRMLWSPTSFVDNNSSCLYREVVKPMTPPLAELQKLKCNERPPIEAPYFIFGTKGTFCPEHFEPEQTWTWAYLVAGAKSWFIEVRDSRTGEKKWIHKNQRAGETILLPPTVRHWVSNDQDSLLLSRNFHLKEAMD